MHLLVYYILAKGLTRTRSKGILGRGQNPMLWPPQYYLQDGLSSFLSSQSADSKRLSLALPEFALASEAFAVNLVNLLGYDYH